MKTKGYNLLRLTCIILLVMFVSCKKDSSGKVSSAEEFIDYTIDGISYSYEIPSDTLTHYSLSGESNTFSTYVRIGCHGQDGNYTDLAFAKSNISVNSDQTINHFGTTAIFGIHNILHGSTNVRITEYGAVGGYIAGNFTGSLIESQDQSISHSLTCSFRVRRIQ